MSIHGYDEVCQYGVRHGGCRCAYHPKVKRIIECPTPDVCKVNGLAQVPITSPAGIRALAQSIAARHQGHEYGECVRCTAPHPLLKVCNYCERKWPCPDYTAALDIIDKVDKVDKALDKFGQS